MLGVADYTLSEIKVITGDLRKALWLNSIILLTKKVIHNSMKEIENFYFQEKHRFYKKGKNNYLRKSIFDYKFLMKKQSHEYLIFLHAYIFL